VLVLSFAFHQFGRQSVAYFSFEKEVNWMKKIVVLACLMTVSAGMAIAQQTISIPFFSDNSSVGRSGFVGLQNTGTTTVAVTATFKDNTGGALAGTGGTFNLTAGQSISFRPNTNIGGGEVQPSGLTDAGVNNGSLQFNSDGGSLAGRYVQIDSGGSFAHNLESSN